jgi:hypothetical protein
MLLNALIDTLIPKTLKAFSLDWSHLPPISHLIPISTFQLLAITASDILQTF